MTDCNFNNLRDSDFSNAIVENWKDYSDYLKKNTRPLPFILSKYLHALNRLRHRDPRNFETMQYNQETESFDHCNCTSKEEQFFHFLSLKNGFKNHLELLENNPKLREEYIRGFQAALCNPTLTKQLFFKSYSDQPCSE
jgi:hypothetical protein